MFQNKAVLTALVDAFAGATILIVTRFFPEWREFTVSMWAILQPLAVALIAYYAVEPVREALARIK